MSGQNRETQIPFGILNRQGIAPQERDRLSGVPEDRSGIDPKCRPFGWVLRKDLSAQWRMFVSDTSVLDDWFTKIDSDIDFLLTCFLEVLEDLGEGKLAESLPRGTRDSGATPQSIRSLEDVDRELQMMAIAYHLLNIVEENAAAQARRAREGRYGLLHEPGLWGHGLAQLLKQGFSEEDIVAALDTIHVEAVLTAHPTEAKRPPVLRQHRELFEDFSALENSVWTRYERSVIQKRIKVILERLWRTGETYLEKPDVLSELEYVLDYLLEVFPEAVSSVQQRLRQAWREAGLSTKNLPLTERWPRLTFGNWVGGDRDGHPLVTAEVTRKTLKRLRAAALESVDVRLEALSKRLTLSDLFQEPSGELLSALSELKAALPRETRAKLKEYPHEPWREYVEILRCRCQSQNLDETVESPRPEALVSDLELLRQSLKDVGANRIAVAEVDPLLTHIDAFGFHLAALDIRQNSAFYETALSQLLQHGGFEDWDFASWDYEKRNRFLENELQSLRPISPRHGSVGDEAQAVLDCFRVVAQYIENYGNGGIGSFIVSMTRDVSDLLMVYVFAREVGLLRAGEDGLYSEISVVPLFETIEDLDRSPDIMRDFLSCEIVQRSLKRDGTGSRIQQVMLGYSDSSKDGGIFASHWGLHRTQMALVAAVPDIRICFFHGRGGTFSRGAGPTHRFLEALPAGTVGGTVRLTEQGEVITQKFGNAPTAIFNLELLLAGVTVTSLKHRDAAPEDPRLVELCDMLSESSSETYRSLLRSDGFLEFWSQTTPIDALEKSFIGSRPTRRTGRNSVEDLRAIPWVFSWSQARYYLPGWYGVGSALETLQQNDPSRFELIQENLDAFPFIHYVVNNVETSLASADLVVMRDYAALVENTELRDRQLATIEREYTRTEDMIDTLMNGRREVRRPRLIKTLEMRAEGLRRLHHRQIELLRQWRRLRVEERDAEADSLFPSLLLSINAIASAERTTG